MVLFDNQRLKCATGEKCKPADWNADKQVFRKAYPLAGNDNDKRRPKRPTIFSHKWRKRLSPAGQSCFICLLTLSQAFADMAMAALGERNAAVGWDIQHCCQQAIIV